jgi:hypothetical protein
MDREQALQEIGEVGEVQRVRAVAESLVGILVHFHEEAVDADGDGRARERRNEAALTAR